MVLSTLLLLSAGIWSSVSNFWLVTPDSTIRHHPSLGCYHRSLSSSLPAHLFSSEAVLLQTKPHRPHQTLSDRWFYQDPRPRPNSVETWLLQLTFCLPSQKGHPSPSSSSKHRWSSHLSQENIWRCNGTFLPISQRIDYKIIVLTYRCLHGQSPYLTCLVTLFHTCPFVLSGLITLVVLLSPHNLNLSTMVREPLLGPRLDFGMIFPNRSVLPLTFPFLNFFWRPTCMSLLISDYTSFPIVCCRKSVIWSFTMENAL
jgi:hypothetical protein